MVWEWSHTSEAYVNARAQLDAQSDEWLRVVWSEWQAYTTREDDPDAFDTERYESALVEAADIPTDILADTIWDRMSEAANCTNGGWSAWSCPFGCGCHLVPFDPPDADEDEAAA